MRLLLQYQHPIQNSAKDAPLVVDRVYGAEFGVGPSALLSLHGRRLRQVASSLATATSRVRLCANVSRLLVCPQDRAEPIPRGRSPCGLAMAQDVSFGSCALSFCRWRLVLMVWPYSLKLTRYGRKCAFAKPSGGLAQRKRTQCKASSSNRRFL